MATMAKNLIFGAMGVAVLVLLAAILDMALGFPFGPYPADGGSGRMVMDVTLILGSAAVLYMGYDAYKDLR